MMVEYFQFHTRKTDGVGTQRPEGRLTSNVMLAQLVNEKRSHSLGHTGGESFAQSLRCSPFSHSRKNLVKTRFNKLSRKRSSDRSVSPEKQ